MVMVITFFNFVLCTLIGERCYNVKTDVKMRQTVKNFQKRLAIV